MDSFDIEFLKIQDEYNSRPKDELLERISKHSAKVVIFGSGAVGCSLASSLIDVGGDIVAFCDNFKTGINKMFQIPIVSPEQLARNYKDAIVIVAVDYKFNNEIYNQVLKMGFSKKNVFRRYSGYELYDINELMRHYEGYKWVYNFFDDETSKKIILDRIRGYLFYYEMEHSPCEKQYFEEDIIQFSDHEIFIDGGCYIGDTALEFIQRVGGKYDYIYGFEPELANFNQAKENLGVYKNIKIVNKGLWDKDDVLSFSCSKSSSKIVENGETSIALTSLDTIFADKPKNMLPTFIKLDIEGSEKRAIIGAKEIISKAHPKIAVCVYHKPEDIYELPQIIKNFGDYKFSLRHYSKGDVETVLYAI